jgi:hypothetical protein
MEIDNDWIKQVMDRFVQTTLYKKKCKRIDLTYCRVNNAAFNRMNYACFEDDELLRLSIEFKRGEITFNNFRESFFVEVFKKKDCIFQAKINEYGFEMVELDSVYKYVEKLYKLFLEKP